MKLKERLSRISLFRWRFEWAFLVLIAASVVWGEQAREQRQADPYLIVQTGRSATATVRAGRVDLQTVSPRWMRKRQEARTFLDLEWLDHDGVRRTIGNYLLDIETIIALRIDPNANTWPAEVQILYLDQSHSDATSAMAAPLASPQPHCAPRHHCRVVVLAPNARTQAEIDADLADYLALWAPSGLWLGLLGLLSLLGLRLAGILDSRPSLE